MATLRFRKPSEIDICDETQEDWWSASKTHKRRWRMAFTAISFTRLLFSLSKKVLDNDGSLLRTLSYVAIDVPRINEDSPLDNKAVTLLTVDPTKLRDMVRDKNFQSLSEFGGVQELALILETDVKNGINGGEADLIHRQNVFGANKYQKPPPKGFLKFVFDALKDITIIILLACAVLSLGFGIKQHGWKDGWYDGGSIILAVVLVVVVSAVSDFKQSKQFQKLSTKSSDIRVEVVREGRRQPISIFDVVVGDIVCLKIGDQIPSDGLFVEGHSLKVDESSMTGESDHIEIKEGNPFMLSGTKVTDGFGFMLVTSVGMNTAWGEMMSSINRDLNEETPLQVRLNKLTSYIGKIGLLVAALVLLVMLIRYFTGNTRDDKGNKEFNGSKTKFDDVMNVVVSIVSAAVTIIVVAIPEGLPLAVTLTLAYSMKCMMADHAMVRKLSSCETMGSATIICTDKTGTLTLNEMKVTEFWLGKEAMKDDSSAGLAELSHNPCRGLQFREKENNEKTIHTHWKGAAEMILAMCSSYYDREGVLKVMDEDERLQFESIIKNMAQKSLRCIAFAYKEVEEESGQVLEKLDENGLTLLGLVGLKDPCRPGVSAAVESCRAAGVNIKMITGDNVHTAKAIALECKILNPNDDLGNEAVVEGVHFRNYSPEERMEKIDKILVMARSSPFDKLLMVQCLKQKGHVVAVTGDGTNDAPALKEADIGLSMGIQGTEVAKESSDIVILDDNFTTVVTVLRWGRCVYTNIQKFLQFQLTVNVAALVINFVAAVSSGKVPLTAVQLLWVNLIMDTLGALALATEKPTNDLMTKPPVGRLEPLITKIMWRNLIAQAVYQVTILLVLQFKGKSIFGVKESIKSTLIFNTFVLCQVFNEFNARKLEKKNIFKGILTNKLFMAIVGITIVLQLVMVEFLKRFANTERLNWGQWGVCIGLAALSWPIGWLVKFIPVSGKQLGNQRASMFGSTSQY
uniref:Calcium-transporting ATPase n=1 Tax=Quercus lobata TaxID=97700 RepID=A0A7N2MY40_QUELO